MQESLNTWVDLSNNLECPVCNKSVSVQILVDIRATHARITSTSTFGNSVSVDTECRPKKVNIQHNCDYKEKES